MKTGYKIGMSIFIIILLCYIVIAASTTWDSDVFRINGNISTNQYHAGMYYHNHTGTALNFAVDGTFYYLFFLNATNLNGFTTNNLGVGLNSSFTSQVSGVYQASYMSSGDGKNNHVYYTSVYVNDVNKEECENHHKMAAGGDIIT